MFGEVIKVAVLSDGIAFSNGDALRRLKAVGMKRSLGKGRVISAPRSKIQSAFLKGYPLIRDLDHYRELVQDKRSEGPMHWFSRGSTITMEQSSDPYGKDVPWYVIVDTAIGGRASFLQELQTMGRIRIEQH